MKKIGFKHFNYLTDDFGIWQHTQGTEIDKKHGYALDDSARALIVAVENGDAEKVQIYLNYLDRSIGDSAIINFFGPDREPVKKDWSEDAVAEAYWAIAHSLQNGVNLGKSENLINRLENLIVTFSSTRGRTYSLIGASIINKNIANFLLTSLKRDYINCKHEDWDWIENKLSYANAIMPYAFFIGGKTLSDQESIDLGLEMLTFLNNETKHKKIPIAIGNKGWYLHDGEKALFDQQPIDAGYQVLANLEAFDITKDESFLTEAKNYFLWFWGHNLAQKSLVNDEIEGCRDGIREKSLSNNYGAESIVCYLMAQEKIWPYLD